MGATAAAASTSRELIGASCGGGTGPAGDGAGAVGAGI